MMSISLRDVCSKEVKSKSSFRGQCHLIVEIAHLCHLKSHGKKHLDKVLLLSRAAPAGLAGRYNECGTSEASPESWT